MRLIYFILFAIFFSIQAKTNAQTEDWSPIPYQQTNSYWNLNSQEIIPILLDSVRIENGIEHYGIWEKRISDLNPNCQINTQLYGEFISAWGHGEKNIGGFPFHSIKRVDSRYMLNWGTSDSHEVKLPFYNQFADTFAISDGYHLVLDSLGMLNVLGTLDSVAYFHLVDGNSTSISIEIVWSKSNGLIQFPNFLEFVSGNKEPSQSSVFKLMATEENSVKKGLEYPNSDYFFQPANPQNEYLYHDNYTGIPGALEYYPPCNEYFTVSNNNIQYFESNLIAKNSSCMSGGIDLVVNHSTINLDTFPIGFGFMVGSEWVKTKLYYNGNVFRLEYSQIRANCSFLYYDIPEDSAIIIKDFGYYKKSLSDGAMIGRVQQLESARTSKGNYGTWPANLGFDDLEPSLFQVYPNPSSNGLFNVDSDGPFRARVYDNVGRLVAETTSKIIDLQEQANGIYFLEIETNQQTETLKLVKQ